MFGKKKHKKRQLLSHQSGSRRRTAPAVPTAFSLDLQGVTHNRTTSAGKIGTLEKISGESSSISCSPASADQISPISPSTPPSHDISQITKSLVIPPASENLYSLLASPKYYSLIELIHKYFEINYPDIRLNLLSPIGTPEQIACLTHLSVFINNMESYLIYPLNHKCLSRCFIETKYFKYLCTLVSTTYSLVNNNNEERRIDTLNEAFKVIYNYLSDILNKEYPKTLIDVETKLVEAVTHYISADQILLHTGTLSH